MATFTSDTDQVRKEFRYLKDCFHSLKNKYFESASAFKEISMGMSGDYELAVNEGSTMVRIGVLFSVRDKTDTLLILLILALYSSVLLSVSLCNNK